MKKKFLLICLAVTCVFNLAACGKRKDIKMEMPSATASSAIDNTLQEELVKFVGTDLLKANQKRQDAVNIYNNYFKASSSDASQDDLFAKLTTEALPKYDEYIKDIEALTYTSKEVTELKNLYLESAKYQRDAIQQVINSITNKDETILDKAAEDISKSKEALKKYEDKLKEICEKNEIIINGDFQMKDYKASPSDAK